MTSKIVICSLLTVFLLTVSLAQAQHMKNIPRIGYLRAEKAPEVDIEGFRVHTFRVRDPNGFDDAFKAAIKVRAEGLLTLDDPFTIAHGTRIIDLALRYKLPAVYAVRPFVDAGGLMYYGPDRIDQNRRAANYVNKILKGTKPADLPVEQPTKFELVINLKTAKQIGLTIPPNVLARADRVIR